MAAISRRSLVCPIGIPVTLATAGDLDGVQDATKSFDITGALRVIVLQTFSGTDGSAGIDVIQISHDGGSSWAADTTVLPLSENDVTGTVQASGALQAAGAEQTTAPYYLGFKCGPYEGPTAIRVARDTDGFGGTDWVTGAPAVTLIPIGLTAGSVSAIG